MIEQDLLARIESGRLAVGERVTSGGKVAEQYGVSRNTADRAIGNLAARGYLERVQGSGTFVKDWTSVRGTKRQADSIALICCSVDMNSSPFYAEFMHCVSVEAEKNGYHLVFCASDADDEYTSPLIIRNKQAAGNLVLGRIGENQARVLFEQDVPQLFVGNHRHTYGRPSVRFDIEDACYQITRKLLELDRGDVWLVTEPGIVAHYGQEMLEGYQRAILPAADPIYPVYIGTGSEQGDAYAGLVGRMLASGSEQFCVLVSHEHSVGLLKQLEQAGIGPERGTIVVVDYRKDPWPGGSHVIQCELSPNLLATESVRQIIAMAQDGSPVTGKKYKLQVRTVDDQVRPFEFSWQ